MKDINSLKEKDVVIAKENHYVKNEHPVFRGEYGIVKQVKIINNNEIQITIQFDDKKTITYDKDHIKYLTSFKSKLVNIEKWISEYEKEIQNETALDIHYELLEEKYCQKVKLLKNLKMFKESLTLKIRKPTDIKIEIYN